MQQFTGPKRQGGWIGAAIGVGTSLLSGILGAQSAKEQNRQAREEAQRNRNFQERLSSTAYQRSADDLQAAGLNRILALGSPASTPSGGQAPVVGELSEGISSAQQTAALFSNIKQQSAQARQLNAQAQMTSAQEVHERKKTELTVTETVNRKQIGENLKAEFKVKEQTARKLDQEIKESMIRVEIAEKQKPIMEAELKRLEYILKGLKTEGEIDDTMFGEIMRYIDRLITTVGGAVSTAIGAGVGYAIGTQKLKPKKSGDRNRRLDRRKNQFNQLIEKQNRTMQ